MPAACAPPPCPAAWRSAPRWPAAWPASPRVLLLDEPFGALDEVTRALMQDLLVKVVADYRTAAVLVTHDIDEALLVSDRAILLGGSPAGRIGEWRLDLPRPREDHLAELGRIRIDIVGALRRAIRRH